jgi:basic amino acid/polyamine antiporter, APA family
VPRVAHTPLTRDLTLTHATLLGFGSMLGTGVFVGIAIAAGVAGPAVLPGIVVAALLATCNALSSAQLAAHMPVAGGTYTYARRLLAPGAGFVAGWLFLCAKTASAGAAALACAGYALAIFGVTDRLWRTALALALVAMITALVRAGLKRSARANAILVTLTLLALVAFALAGAPSALVNARANLAPIADVPLPNFLEACALVFVAFTGYGRLATLGEEVREPARTIPRAIIVSLIGVTLLYLIVAFVGVASAGPGAMSEGVGRSGAPLEELALGFDVPLVPTLVAMGAVGATLGVLLNLVLGLSRVALAMGRERDLPAACARLSTPANAPTVSVLCVGAGVGVVTLLGSLSFAWSLSAVTVLVYYALTNLAALRLAPAHRRYPRWIGALGLTGCLALAPFVDWPAWVVAGALLVVGLVVRACARRFTTPA